MRWLELALFFVPFALFAAWRLSVTLARPSLVWAALAAVLVLTAGTVFFGLTRRVPPTDAYVPARIVDGKIVPGQGVPGGGVPGGAVPK
jgi:Family of unknown function (DUF6111)